MSSFLKGYEEAGGCKTCSAVFIRMKKRIDKYDDFQDFYADFIKDIKNESSDKVLAYTLSVLFVIYKSEELDNNLEKFKYLNYHGKKAVEDLLIFLDKNRGSQC